VTGRTPNRDAYPPAWAECALRAILEARHRDTVTGDLLEEYRELVVLRGNRGAQRWYLRQVASFVTAAGVTRSATIWFREGPMFDTLGRRSSVWVVAGVGALAALLSAFVRSDFGPPAPLGVFIAISIVLGMGAVISARSRPDVRSLWRTGLACGVLIAAVLMVRLLFEIVDPIDPLERLLARARDDYSELDYPQRWVPAVAVVLILMGGGLRATWRTNRVGIGILTAATAAAVGSTAYVALITLGNTLPLGAQDPPGNTPSDLQFFGNVPVMLIPLLVMFSTVLGAIGALFGRALAAANTAEPRG
jgi:hypothetical protein